MIPLLIIRDLIIIIVTVLDSGMKDDRLACLLCRSAPEKNQFFPGDFPHLDTIV